MLPLILALTLISKSGGLDAPPPARREFRGVWVATVDRIDWPPKGVNDTSKQKDALDRIMEEAARLHLNAVIFQVRPMGDALYDSRFEPWSEFLTGTQGQPPRPYWDPLAYAISKAHSLGLELHAWFNPYRVWHPAAKGRPAAGYLGNTHPEWVRSYGKYKWLDPGAKGVRAWSEKVILDVVKRYKVDGIHLDDYFYPYPERDSQKQTIPFPDDASWNAYLAAGGHETRAEWRRDNVNSFIRDLYTRIKQIKPWVKFGISPFGIYRPGFPASIKAGIDQYNDLYADPLRWFQQGWCDYLTPQLYWPINRKAQSYPVLARWWADQNTLHRHLWIGNYISGVSSASGAKEVVDQINVTRGIPGADGNILFSMEALMQDRGGLDEALLDGPYHDEALVPESPWLTASLLLAPRVSLAARKVDIEKGSPDERKYVIYTRENGTWRIERVVPAGSVTFQETTADKVAVSALDSFGRESQRTIAAIR